MLLIAEEAVASISEMAWYPVICSKTWLGCHRGFSPFQPFPDPRFLFLLRWCYVSNSREKQTASFRLSCRRLEMWNSKSNEVSVVSTGCWFFSHPCRFKFLPLSVLQNKEMVLASSDVFGFVKLCKKWLFEERTILQLAAFCAVLKVENLAGKETGSMPEHTFIYPILIPFPKAILRKLNFFAWLLGRKPVLEGIHLISLCHFPLQRSSLSFESLLPLLPLMFLARRVPPWAALLVWGWALSAAPSSLCCTRAPDTMSLLFLHQHWFSPMTRVITNTCMNLMGTDFVAGPVVIIQGVMVLN